LLKIQATEELTFCLQTAD